MVKYRYGFMFQKINGVSMGSPLEPTLADDIT